MAGLGGTIFSEADVVDAIRRDSQAHQLLCDRPSTPVAKPAIMLLRAAIITVTLNYYSARWVSLQKVRNLDNLLLSFRAYQGTARAKVDSLLFQTLPVLRPGQAAGVVLRLGRASRNRKKPENEQVLTHNDADEL